MDLDGALDQFEAAWRSGDAPDIRQIVSLVSEQASSPKQRQEIAIELVTVDLWHRWRCRAAEEHQPADPSAETIAHSPSADSEIPVCPKLEDYARRLPDLVRLEEIPARAIGEEYRARLRWGDQPTHDEYLQRFPRQAPMLPDILCQISCDLSVTRRLGKEDETRRFRAGKTTDPPPTAGGDDALPTRIGKYHVLTALDRGGQARVFRAVHPELRQEVAIKLGHPVPEWNAAKRDLLVAEARLLAQLKHPNLVRVHDLDFHQQCPFLVMDYVPGRNLRSETTEQHLVASRAAELVAKIARAIAEVHRKGITHMDLKPANILIDERGEPRVIDFGLAREDSPWSEPSTGEGKITGTLQYMAPEQARGDDPLIGCPTDVFGLGAILYYLLTGRPPFSGETVEEVLGRARKNEFDAGALSSGVVPARLAAICLKAMSTDPRDRYQSAEGLASALEQYSSRPQKFKLAVTASIIAVILTSLVAIVLPLARRQNQAQRETKADATPPRLQVQSQYELIEALFDRPPHHDFPFQFEFAGHPYSGEAVELIDGETIALALQSDEDCYVGIWHIDGIGTVTQLFPNELEQDNFLPSGLRQTIPDRDEYAIQVSASDDVEHVYAVASTQMWNSSAGQKIGPYVVFATPDEIQQWQQNLRGMSLVQREGARVAEKVIPIQVKSGSDDP